MVLKFFKHYPIIKTYHFEGFVNQIEIDRMVSDHLSSYNVHQFKNIAEDHFYSYLLGIFLTL